MTVGEKLKLRQLTRPPKPIKGERGIQGPPGKDGRAGDPGRAGTNGIDGKAGLNGKDGSKGADGLNGKSGHNGDNAKEIELMAKKDNLYWKHEGEDWQYLATMPKGERGPRGAGGGGGSSSTGVGTADDLTEVVKYVDTEYTYFSGYKTVGWQVNRWDIDTVRTIATGSGTKPGSLAECQALSYN